MNRERAQALVEAVVAVPACIACALAIVDAGIVVRDRIAIAQAAGRAASAHLAGGDEVAAARRAVPASMRPSVRVEIDGPRVVVEGRSDVRLARIAHVDVDHRSSVEVAR